MIKKITKFLFIFLTSISFSAKISNYDVTISFNKDKSLKIVEKITYNPMDEDYHGITLDKITNDSGLKAMLFPFKTKTGIFNFTANENVYSENMENYTRYRLGNPNYYLPRNKEKTYEVSYDLYNAVRFDEKNTQIYLNAIPHFFDMPMDKVKITLDFDKKAFNSLEVFTSKMYEKGDNYIIDGNVITNKVPLNAYEGITVKLNLDRSMYPFSEYDAFRDMIKVSPDIVIVTIAILIELLILIIGTYIKMRNRIDKVIVPEYKVDEKISPAFAKYICDSNIKDTKQNILTPVFYSLISKNLIKSKDKYEVLDDVITQNKKEELHSWTRENTKKYYLVEKEEVQKALDDENLLSKEEKIALSNFYNTKDDIFSSDKNIFKTNIKINEYIKKLYETHVGKNLAGGIIMMFTAILIASFVLMGILGSISISLAILVIVTGINIGIIKKLNICIFKKQGKDIVANIKGFVMYFTIAEKNIFKSFETEQEMINYAKKMLPYAVATGVKTEFITLLDKEISAKNFNKDRIYSDIYYPYYFNYPVINQSFNDSFARNSRLEASNIRHSSGGGFSSSGSGFSGGGFSGGGGSSW